MVPHDVRNQQYRVTGGHPLGLFALQTVGEIECVPVGDAGSQIERGAARHPIGQGDVV